MGSIHQNARHMINGSSTLPSAVNRVIRLFYGEVYWVQRTLNEQIVTLVRIRYSAVHLYSSLGSTGICYSLQIIDKMG